MGEAGLRREWEGLEFRCGHVESEISLGRPGGRVKSSAGCGQWSEVQSRKDKNLCVVCIEMLPETTRKDEIIREMNTDIEHEKVRTQP